MSLTNTLFPFSGTDFSEYFCLFKVAIKLSSIVITLPDNPCHGSSFFSLIKFAIDVLPSPTTLAARL